MGGVFYIVLNMSITATLIGLLVAAIRLALRRGLPAAAQYALWGLVGLRLILPISVPSKASLLNLVDSYALNMASISAGDSGATMTNMVKTANAYFPIHFKTNLVEQIFNAAGWAWLAGALLAVAVSITLYAGASARFRRAVPVADGGLLAECAAQARVRRKTGLYASDAVASPVVFGVFRPRIIIPASMAGDTQTLRYALLHEFTHIRRGDNSLRLISAIVLCAHWFNPFAWLFFALAGRDMELACDARVLRSLDRREQKGYALALAALASRRQPVLASAFGQSAVKERVIRITRYRKITLAAGILTFLCLLALAVVLMTNPAA